MLRILFLLPLLLALGGCGTMADPREWFGGDSGPEPAELKDIQATIRPATLWSVDVGEGATQYNRLVAAVGFALLFSRARRVRERRRVGIHPALQAPPARPRHGEPHHEH
ncbi:MAG: hypothetical protein DSZ01_05665, partial [Gammaproteobacteria bacterium]